MIQLLDEDQIHVERRLSFTKFAWIVLGALF